MNMSTRLSLGPRSRCPLARRPGILELSKTVITFSTHAEEGTLSTAITVKDTVKLNLSFFSSHCSYLT